MAYSDFTLEAAVETFHLEIVEPVGIFSNLEGVDPGDDFTTKEWMFLKLEEQRLSVDLMSYRIAQCDQILGILSSMVEQKA